MWPLDPPGSGTTSGSIAAAAGGFIGGFTHMPTRLTEGGQRIERQGGLILPNPDTPEREEVELLGKEIRLVAQVATNPAVREVATVHGRQAWSLMPESVQNRLIDSGYEGLGNLAGGAAANRVLLFGLNFLAGSLVSLHPRMRILTALRAPAQIASRTLLDLLSLQGTTQMVSQRQRQIFADYPGSEGRLRDALDQIMKPPK